MARRAVPAVLHRIMDNTITGPHRAKLGDVMWTLNSLFDLEYDFSAVHRIENMYRMNAVRFFRFAIRILESEGTVTRLHQEQLAKKRQSNPQAGRPIHAQPSTKQTDEEFLKVMRMREGSKVLVHDPII